MLWVNEYFGRVEHEGRGLVIPRLNQDTFGRDVEEVIARKWTLQEAIESAAMAIMVRQRLRVVQRELFEQLDGLGF